MDNSQLIADLRRTREVLEQRGRCTIVMEDSAGRVCLDGAIALATVPGFKIDLAPFSHMRRSERAVAVAEALGAHVPMDRRIFGLTGGTIKELMDEFIGGVVDARLRLVYLFNDASGTTDQEVFDLIDKAIAAAMGEIGTNPRRVEVVPATPAVRPAPTPTPTPAPVKEPVKEPVPA